MSWTIKRAFRLVKNSLELAVTKDILRSAKKLLQRQDGSFLPYQFIDLPLGMTKIQQFLYVACPQISREVLLQDASPHSPTSRFNRGWMSDIFRNDLGDTLFTAEFSKHAELRRFISTYFRQSLDKRFGENLCFRTHALIDKWLGQPEKGINVSKDLPFFTSQAIIDNFIGKIEDPLSLHEAMETILRNMERQFQLKPPFTHEKLLHARQVVKNVAAEVTRTEKDGNSLIGLMKGVKNEFDTPIFSQNDIEAMASFLFLAGQETVASILPAILYHCIPEFQQKVCDEWKNEGEIVLPVKMWWDLAKNLSGFKPSLTRVSVYSHQPGGLCA